MQSVASAIAEGCLFDLPSCLRALVPAISRSNERRSRPTLVVHVAPTSAAAAAAAGGGVTCLSMNARSTLIIRVSLTSLITMTTRTSIRQPVCNHSNRAAVAEADRARDSRTDRQTEGGCRGEVRCSAFQSISRSRRACHVTFRDANSHRPGCLSVRVRLPTLLSTL